MGREGEERGEGCIDTEVPALWSCDESWSKYQRREETRLLRRQRIHGDTLFNYYNPDTTRFPEADHVARQLWATSGLGPRDVDVAMIYENFSPVVFYQLEAYGFCPYGEAKDFIADGHIGRGGSLPVNTNGGLLGEAYIPGLNNISEGVRQVRGTAANQIDGARTVLCAAGRSAVLLGAG